MTLYYLYEYLTSNLPTGNAIFCALHFNEGKFKQPLFIKLPSVVVYVFFGMFLIANICSFSFLRVKSGYV